MSQASSSTLNQPPPDLQSVISEITCTGLESFASLVTALRALVKRDVGETILASSLPGGGDPLGILDPTVNTLGYLFVLTARLGVAGAPPVAFSTITHFCRVFAPEQARLAPERVASLARSIVHMAESQHLLKAAVAPLCDLTTRYPPSLSYLTSQHQYFLHACVASHHFTPALPILSVPISEIDTSLSPLTYHDVLNYHYTGGLALLALKRFRDAAVYLEACVTAPAQGHPAALQLEALKKLLLVRLIIHGATPPLPKYAHPSLWRYLKNTPYAALAKAYTGPIGALRELIEKETKLFESERNMGLVKQTLVHAPRRVVRTLTATYLTLTLPELVIALGDPEADEASVRALVLSMIEREEISATLDAAGTVTFHAVAPTVLSALEQMDDLLRAAQTQGTALGELNREVGRSREFIMKAVKDKEGGGMDELELYGAAPPPSYRDWDEGGF